MAPGSRSEQWPTDDFWAAIFGADGGAREDNGYLAAWLSAGGIDGARISRRARGAPWPADGTRTPTAGSGTWTFNSTFPTQVGFHRPPAAVLSESRNEKFLKKYSAIPWRSFTHRRCTTHPTRRLHYPHKNSATNSGGNDALQSKEIQQVYNTMKYQEIIWRRIGIGEVGWSMESIEGVKAKSSCTGVRLLRK